MSMTVLDLSQRLVQTLASQGAYEERLKISTFWSVYFHLNHWFDVLQSSSRYTLLDLSTIWWFYLHPNGLNMCVMLWILWTGDSLGRTSVKLENLTSPIINVVVFPQSVWSTGVMVSSGFWERFFRSSCSSETLMTSSTSLASPFAVLHFRRRLRGQKMIQNYCCWILCTAVT